MKKHEENCLSMFKTVDTATEHYAVVIDSVLSLKTARIELKQIISDLGTAIQKQSTDVTGFTEEKKQRRKKMTEEAFKTGQLVSAFAIAQKLSALDKEVNLSMTFLNRMPDDVVGEICTKIYGKAKENLPYLADYGITQTTLNNLKTWIDDYKDKTQLNTVLLKQKYGQTQIIDALIKEGKALLSNRFDKLMLILNNTHPEAYHAYVAARNSMPKQHSPRNKDETASEASGI